MKGEAIRRLTGVRGPVGGKGEAAPAPAAAAALWVWWWVGSGGVSRLSLIGANANRAYIRVGAPTRTYPLLLLPPPAAAAVDGAAKGASPLSSISIAPLLARSVGRAAAAAAGCDVARRSVRVSVLLLNPRGKARAALCRTADGRRRTHCSRLSLSIGVIGVVGVVRSFIQGSASIE